MTALAPRALGFGEILDTGFTLYRRHFSAFFLIALLPRIPEVLFALVVMSLVPPGTREFSGFLILPWSFFATFLTLGALAWASGEAWAGRDPQVVEALRRGLGRWVSVTVAGVVGYMAVFSGFFLAIIPGTLFFAGLAAGGLAADELTAGSLAAGGALLIVGVLVAALLIVVPAIFLFASFFAFAPVAALEEKGPIDSLSRSWALARGGRLRILGITLVAYILVVVPTLAAAAAGFLVVGGGTGFFSDDPTAMEGSFVWLDGMIRVSGPVISALVWPLFVAILVVLYLDRRARVDTTEFEDALDRLESLD